MSIHTIMVYTRCRQYAGHEAIFADDIPEHMCQPVQARAPEMMLRHPWSTLIDIWSLGCIVSRRSFLTGWHVDWLTFCLEDVWLSHGCSVIRLLSACFRYLQPSSAAHHWVSRSLPADLPCGLSWPWKIFQWAKYTFLYTPCAHLICLQTNFSGSKSHLLTVSRTALWIINISTRQTSPQWQFSSDAVWLLTLLCGQVHWSCWMMSGSMVFRFSFCIKFEQSQ